MARFMPQWLLASQPGLPGPSAKPYWQQYCSTRRVFGPLAPPPCTIRHTSMWAGPPSLKGPPPNGRLRLVSVDSSGSLYPTSWSYGGGSYRIVIQRSISRLTQRRPDLKKRMITILPSIDSRSRLADSCTRHVFSMPPPCLSPSHPPDQTCFLNIFLFPFSRPPLVLPVWSTSLACVGDRCVTLNRCNHAHA